MLEERQRFGLLVSAIGSAALAVSVFLPWYAISVTAYGAASAQQELNSIAQEYGNAAFQSEVSSVGAGLNGLAGHQLATLSAHQLLKYVSVVLLILAAIALLAALFRLAGVSGVIDGGGGQIAAVGVVAGLCVLFRMIDPPASQAAFVSLTLTWGVWLALVSSAAIVIGGLWSTSAPKASSSRLASWELRS